MPELTFTRLAGSAGSARLLVVGPSLGTSVEALWDGAAALLGDHAEVVGWDLPGHGRSVPATTPLTVAGLADAVRRRAAEQAAGRPASYAGASTGGAVALQLALDPGVLGHVTCIAAAASIGEPGMWHERAALVRSAGTPVMVAPSALRWFAPGFVEREPAVAARLLVSLSDADRESYALACEALAGFDLRPRLAEVRAPLVVASGEYDVVVPVEVARETAEAAGAAFEVLPGCGHLPPVENPAAVVALLRAVAQEAVHG
jgi:pimeloyl-ACP methyl ester carboxylesterase